jgi:hypothetical protein
LPLPFPNARLEIRIDTIHRNPIEASYQPGLSYSSFSARIDINRPIRMDTLDCLLRYPVNWPILRGTVPETKRQPIRAIGSITVQPDNMGRAIIGGRNGTFAFRNFARACDVTFGKSHMGGGHLEETMCELRHLVPDAVQRAGDTAPRPWPSLTFEVQDVSAVDAFIYFVSTSSRIDLWLLTMSTCLVTHSCRDYSLDSLVLT